MSQSKVASKFIKFLAIGLFIVFFFAGIVAQRVQQKSPTTLTAARQEFEPVLIEQTHTGAPAPVAPPTIFKTLKYPTAQGNLSAYLSPDPKDGKKHPAIVWIVGGDCNTIGDVWSPAPPENDQTAAAFRKAGIIMMFPSLRGGNDNPGRKEGFFGEVDDAIAAAQYLAKQSYVDPQRIYLGGHSTGGTLVLLVAESSTLFRGIFSFGPVENVALYGRDPNLLPFDISNRQEVKLRSPIYWLDTIASPTWVFEGTRESNIDSLRAMARATSNSQVKFIELEGMDHFNGLAPVNQLIARKILQDTGASSQISFAEQEIAEVTRR